MAIQAAERGVSVFRSDQVFRSVFHSVVRINPLVFYGVFQCSSIFTRAYA